MRIARLISLCINSLLAGLVSAEVSPPALNLTLTPNFSNGSLSSLTGELIIASPQISANQTLVAMPLYVADAPTQRYDGNALQARDSNGPLLLEASDGEASAIMQTRFWNAARPTNGDVTLRFTGYPRVFNKSIPGGPLFDMRTNDDGLLGSLLAFVPGPINTTTNYTITVSWNLTNAPSWTRGVWSWGEGPDPVTKVGDITTFLYTYFAVGRISSYPPETTVGSKFGMYWFQQPPFNTTAVASFVQRLLDVQTSFWNDTSDDGYRVFIRYNENNNLGGTALRRSFMFGWHNTNVSTLDLNFLLAHEMTHNWPALSGSVPNITTYQEGLAEFYSTRLLWLNGFISTAEYVKEANAIVEQYYTSPAVNLTDVEAQEQAWQSRSAQKVPYGRGFLYFANVDVQMREKYDGTLSLDTLVLNILQRQRGGLSYTLEDWFDQLRQYLGEYAVQEYVQMASGTPLIQPQQGSLGPCFEVSQTRVMPDVYQWVTKNGTDGISSCFV
ncbi:hypothetical protein DBV05_g12643 [Lasiodiplodia theobromae]|uniref:Peptidase M61 catalytic domain-containing protein n=1 Tax=Lasiodiplodia theobromae TaxID=45133 RepID=A0A5N5CTL4_9PEZI|nr:hypothetical protein DBV05_g12643 [Lasiodiplodia theobromae]